MKLNPKQLFLMFISVCILIFITSDVNFADSAKPDVLQQEQIKKILATADSVRVEIIGMECAGSEDMMCNEVDTFVTDLKPDKILVIVKDLKLTLETPRYFETGAVPDVCFIFYKNRKPLNPYITIGYGPVFFNYCYSITPKIFNRELDDATTCRFRQMILQEPLIVKKLKEIGGKDINLDPNYKPKFRPNDN